VGQAGPAGTVGGTGGPGIWGLAAGLFVLANQVTWQPDGAGHVTRSTGLVLVRFGHTSLMLAPSGDSLIVWRYVLLCSCVFDALNCPRA